MKASFGYGGLQQTLTVRFDIRELVVQDKIRLAQDLIRELLCTDLLGPDDHQDFADYAIAAVKEARPHHPDLKGN